MSTDWENQFKHPIDYLLLESLDFILQESGYKLVLDQTGSSISLWTTQTKN